MFIDPETYYEGSSLRRSETLFDEVENVLVLKRDVKLSAGDGAKGSLVGNVARLRTKGSTPIRKLCIACLITRSDFINTVASAR